MKRFVLVIMGLFPAVLLAQDLGNLGSRVSPDMMKKMTEAQACFEKIDQKQLEALQKEATAETEAIRQLCKAGSRRQVALRAGNCERAKWRREAWLQTACAVFCMCFVKARHENSESHPR